MTSWRWWAGVALLVVTSLSGVPAHADGPTRILVLGDSVTHGSAGDFTWRFRLWQALRASDAEVDFVGPRSDVYDNVAGRLGSDAYADNAFDRDHAALWGLSLWAPDVPLAELVEEFEPDVVVEARAINDFIWLHRPVADVVGDVMREIADARAVDPEVDFVVNQLPQTWFDVPGRSTEGDVAAYNDALLDVVDPLDTADSHVEIARTGHGLVEGSDTLDPVHLTATGEVTYAGAVADALARFGVGGGAPDPAPVVVNGHWGAAALTVSAVDRGAALTWIGPPGAEAELVWRRDATTGQDWERLPIPLGGRSWVAGGLSAGHRYEFRLQALKGVVEADSFSNIVEVTPTAPDDPFPSPPRAPTGIDITPGFGRLWVGWDAVSGASSYDVTWSSPTGESAVLSARVPGVVIDRLVPGLTYTVSVVARNAGGSGPAATAVGMPLVPGTQPSPSSAIPPVMAVLPTAPSGLTAVAGIRRLRVAWDPGAPGTTYDIGLVGATTGFRERRLVDADSTVFDDLVAGESYTVLVTPTSRVGSGPVGQVSGTPRGPKVPGPTRVIGQVRGGGRVVLSWRGRPGATTYTVAGRREGRWVTVRTTTVPRATLRIGSEVTRFRVRSWYDLVAGGWSGVVRLPRG